MTTALATTFPPTRIAFNHAAALSGTVVGGVVTGYLVAGKAGMVPGALVHLGLLGLLVGVTGGGGLSTPMALRMTYLLGGAAALGYLGYQRLKR